MNNMMFVIYAYDITIRLYNVNIEFENSARHADAVTNYNIILCGVLYDRIIIIKILFGTRVGGVGE